MTAQPSQTQVGETQLEEPADDDASPRPRAWARLVPVADPGAPFELVSEAIIVGRSREKGCHYVFNHPRISSRHCEIRLRGDEVVLTDLSQNGTFVNAAKIAKESPVVIRSGDRVALLQPRSSAPELCLNAFHLFLRGDGRAGAPACAGAPAADEGAVPTPLPPPALPPPPPRAAGGGGLLPCGSLACGDSLLQYELKEVLGQGSFAVVRRGVHRESGQQCAVKVIAKRRLLGQRAGPSSEEKEKVLREAKILKRICHPHVVKLYDVIETAESLYLVMELVEGGELYDNLISHGVFPEPQARELTAQLLSALAYLHAQGIVHRDLKPENILLAYAPGAAPAPSQPRSAACGVPLLKLADFGLAKMVHGECAAKTFCGTPQYFAPEVLESRDSSRGYGSACDIWSAGVILYVLLSAQPPFEGEDLYAQVRRGHYALPHDRWGAISPAAKHLLSRMMMVDPQRRITVGAAMRHPWMRCEELSDAEQAELDALALERSAGRAPQPPLRGLAEDDIEDLSEEEGHGASSQFAPRAQPNGAGRRPKPPVASLTTTAAPTPASTQPPHHAPPRAAAGLMAPPKAPGAGARPAAPGADSALAAKRRRTAGNPSAPSRLPFAAPPLLSQGKLPLAAEPPAAAPAAARRLGLAPACPTPAPSGPGGDGGALRGAVRSDLSPAPDVQS